MKCTACHREWSAANSGVICPFCGEDCRLPEREIDRMKSEAILALTNRKYEDAAPLLHEVAEQGDPQSQYLYADLLLSGKGVKESAPKARVFLLMAARQGYHQASLRLSEVLKKMALPLTASLFWLRVSAAQGNPEAAHRLARSYEKGINMDCSLPRALYWYIQSCAGGYEEATLDLIRYYTEDGTELSRAHARYFMEKIRNHRFSSRLYQHRLGKGERVPPQVEKKTAGVELCELGALAEEQGEPVIAAFLYKTSGAMGNPEGQYHYGICLEEGIGVEKNVTEAATCYKKAADAGHSPAMTHLGLLLRNSSEEGISSAVAMSWIQKAAAAGEPEAEYALGCAYFGGTLTRRNLLWAREWFGKAASHGHEDAKRRMTELDETMEELFQRAAAAVEEKDAKEAFRLYFMAAEMGHTDARCCVAACFQSGIGTKKNGAMAVKYYKLAAKDGSSAALFKLGMCYFRGDGVPCDYRVARAILTQAEQEGFSEATEILAEMDARKQKKLARKLYSISSVVYRRGEVDDAIRFRVLAASKGSPQAMFLLGCHYEFGDGLPYDHDAADGWYRKATSNGFHLGASRLKNGFARAKKHRTDPTRRR